MARVKKAPFYLRSQGGRAYIEFTDANGKTRKSYLGISYDPKRSSPAESRAAQKAAEDRWRSLTDGRVLEKHERVNTDLTLDELYAIYLTQWEPPANAALNERKSLASTLINRRYYGRLLREWAIDATSPRWRNDSRTPLERVVADDGPEAFLAWRLLSVKRKTMRKEKSNLVQFLNWTKAAGYSSSTPPVVLPPGKGVESAKMKKSGLGKDLRLTALEVAKVIAALPEESHRKARNGGEVFRVRPFFDFMRLTGLRPVTIERLEAGRNWQSGQTFLDLDDSDDKARYGRRVPLLPAAVAILEKYAPKKGHIFGHHDFRKHIKAAAEKALPKEKAPWFGAYHLRHFLATYLANRAGTNLPGVQFVLGHKDLETTSQYVHADEDAARAVLGKVAKDMDAAMKKAEKWAR